MRSILLASYTLRVRGRQSKEWLLLDQVAPPLYETIGRTLRRLQTWTKDKSSRYAMRVTQLESDGADLWGTINIGDYGFSSHLIDTDTFTTSYERSNKDADTIPLYFRFHLPAGLDSGIWIVQRFGARSAFSQLKQEMTSDFRDATPGHLLAVSPLIPTAVLESLLEGGVKEMALISHRPSEDITDRLRLRGTEKRIARVETKVQAKRDSFLSKGVPSWLRVSPTDGVTILEHLGPDTRNVRLKIEYKGKQRVYDIGKRNAMSPYVDITDEISRGAGRHPDFASIDAYCRYYRDDLLEQLGRERLS